MEVKRKNREKTFSETNNQHILTLSSTKTIYSRLSLSGELQERRKGRRRRRRKKKKKKWIVFNKKNNFAFLRREERERERNKKQR